MIDILNLLDPVNTVKEVITSVFPDKKDDNKKPEKKETASEDERVEFVPDSDDDVKTDEQKGGLLTHIKKCFSNFVSDIKEMFFSEEEPASTDKNGKIEYSSQGQTGDCWLLSGVNALSYTETGAKAIKDALEYGPDGTTVHFKYAGDYFVPDEIIEKIKEINPEGLSQGDLDMFILEYATQLAKSSLNGPGTIAYDPTNNDWNLQKILSPRVQLHDFEDPEGIINGGHTEEIMYFLTGKAGLELTTPSDKEFALNAFTLDKNKDIVLTCASPSNENITLKSPTGEDIIFYGCHAYAVKSADENQVILINPWDSSKEIAVTRESFLSIPSITFLDLSDRNPEVDLILNTDVNVDKKEDGSEVITKIDEMGRVVMTMTRDENFNTQSLTYCTYDEDGSRAEVTHRYNDDGLPVFENMVIYKDENGYMPIYARTSNLIYNETLGEMHYFYDENGALTSFIVTEYEFQDDGTTKPNIEIYEVKDGEFVKLQDEKAKRAAFYSFRNSLYR